MSQGESLAKKLISELKDAGGKAAYLDRVRDRVDVWQSQDELKREILKEMAASLGRAEQRVTAALECLDALGREIDELSAEEGRGGELEKELGRRIDAFNDARRRALLHLWELTIQREALGFRRHEELRRLYPVPPARHRVAP